MNAFLTGSRVYGRPREDSDVDMVVRVDISTARVLYSLSDTFDAAKFADETDPDYGGIGVVRFGKLNLILCTDDDQYTAWRMGTRAMMKEGGKFTREMAVNVIKAQLMKIGAVHPGGSGGDGPVIVQGEDATTQPMPGDDKSHDDL